MHIFALIFPLVFEWVTGLGNNSRNVEKISEMQLMLAVVICSVLTLGLSTKDVETHGEGKKKISLEHSYFEVRANHAALI